MNGDDQGNDRGTRVRDLVRARYAENGPRRLTGRLIFGVIVLVLGLTWTLENMGFDGASQILRWWPALLLTYGLVRFFGLDGARRQTSGALFMVAGAWILAREMGWVSFRLSQLWPVFLIIIGVSLVWRSLRGPAPDAGPNSRSNYPRPFAFMGANTTYVESKTLEALEVTAVMGGVELDLHHASTERREVVAEVFAWWGGIEICVPDDWEVISEVTPIMGGVENQSRVSPGVSPVTTLIVRGLVIMGGIEIKNGKAEGRYTGAKTTVVVGEPRDADEARRRDERERRDAQSQKPVE